MEEFKKKSAVDMSEKEIVFSKSIKAGKRIYYLDVKKSRNEDLFLAITESKKKKMGNSEDAQVTYEKHKIFLYKEDFDNFAAGLEEVIAFIKREQGEAPTRESYNAAQNNEEKAEEPKKSFFDKLNEKLKF